MADEKQEESKDTKAAEKQRPVTALPGANKAKEKEAWTLKKCLKIARRFDNEQEWAKNKPSSYKAATAHGWLKECLAAQGESSHAAPRAA